MAGMSRLARMAYSVAALSPMFATALLGLDRIRPAFNLVISNVPGARASCCATVAFSACRKSLPSIQRLLDFTEHVLVQLERAAGVK